jgi:glycosyltransferase involved in cell wall biosynthesis
MTEKLPKLSVVVPSYNQGQFIERTLQSIVDQNYPDLELIVLDGGSTDGSVAIIERFRDHITHFETGPDGGQSAAIAKGFGLATGKYISWLNSDDTYAAGALLGVGRYLAANAHVEFVYGNMTMIDAFERQIAFRRTPDFNLGVMKYAFLTVAQHSAFWSKALFDRTGGIDVDLRFCMDYDLFVRMASESAPHHIDVTIGNFRIHGESKTATLETVRQQEDRLVQERYCRVKPSRPLLFALVRRFYFGVLVWLTLKNGSFFPRVAARLRNGFASYAS